MHIATEFSVAFIIIVLDVAKISLQLSGALEVAFSVWIKVNTVCFIQSLTWSSWGVYMQ